MKEVKDTKYISTASDVEARIYHAFEVYKYLPPVKPQGYFNIFHLMKKDLEYIQEYRATFCSHDYTLAEEVCDVWWNWLRKNLDLETLEIIKFRCGAPIIKGGKQTHGWTGVRGWKLVGSEFGMHRNVARKKWNKAIQIILEMQKVSNKCSEVQNIAF